MMEFGWTTLIQSSVGQTLLAQVSGGETALNGLALMLWLVVMVLVIAGVWKTFEKAGQPGWAVLIPIFIAMDIATAFGKSALFAIGLVFLGPIFYMILGFGDARYTGPPAR